MESGETGRTEASFSIVENWEESRDAKCMNDDEVDDPLTDAMVGVAVVGFESSAKSFPFSLLLQEQRVQSIRCLQLLLAQEVKSMEECFWLCWPQGFFCDE